MKGAKNIEKNVFNEIKPHKNHYICNQPIINSHSLMMKQLIACCGLDCESCDARIATVRDDNELREKQLNCGVS